MRRRASFSKAEVSAAQAKAALSALLVGARDLDRLDPQSLARSYRVKPGEIARRGGA